MKYEKVDLYADIISISILIGKAKYFDLLISVNTPIYKLTQLIIYQVTLAQHQNNFKFTTEHFEWYSRILKFCIEFERTGYIQFPIEIN